jgi:hypothetical protein
MEYKRLWPELFLSSFLRIMRPPKQIVCTTYYSP